MFLLCSINPGEHQRTTVGLHRRFGWRGISSAKVTCLEAPPSPQPIESALESALLEVGHSAPHEEPIAPEPEAPVAALAEPPAPEAIPEPSPAQALVARVPRADHRQRRMAAAARSDRDSQQLVSLKFSDSSSRWMRSLNCLGVRDRESEGQVDHSQPSAANRGSGVVRRT